MLYEQTFSRDSNGIPYTASFESYKTVSLSASNTTASEILFAVTGAVEVFELWGTVETALSSNITAAHWRLNDQTAQVAISAAAGTTLSSAPAGSVITRRSLVSVALVLASAAAGAISDPVAATAPSYFMPFVAVQKTGEIATNVEFRYTTTNTPASGVIRFGARWFPLSEGSSLVAL